MFRFKLPDIGEGVVEAEVVEWKVEVGEVVAVDQTLVELMTDKASFEIPSPVAGKIARLGAREGDVVKVGEVLLEIDDGEGAAAGETVAPAQAATPPAPAPPAPAPPPSPAEAAPPPPRAAPKAAPATASPAKAPAKKPTTGGQSACGAGTCSAKK